LVKVAVIAILLSVFTQHDVAAQDDSQRGDIRLSKATFGSGCFWCTEAVFLQLEGVESALPGYCGGQTEDPTYKQVCSGTTGHAEVIQITYDASRVSFEKLLEVFWKSHDPTTLNRQGNDVGTQYRSVIFFHDEEQKSLAEKYKAKLDAAGIFGDPIVTEISPLAKFYVAENYHKDYYALNSGQPYCVAVVRPKVEKIRKLFEADLKKTEN
jgi:peptide-methionine (S)-S-oxide reductase